MEEHRRMYGLVERLRSGAVEEFCGVLREHVRKEERVLFEEAQRLLTRAQLDEMGERRRAGVGSG
jgi:hemerythrin-like domain-containing protein